MQGARRSFALHAVVALVALSLVAGCPQGDKTTTIVGGTLNSDYPGSDTEESVPDDSPDGQAASDPGIDVEDVRVFPDHGNPGQALVLFTGSDPGDESNDPVFLYASYYDGIDLTRPVEVKGENQDDHAPVSLDTATVTFLNGITGRAGDALVLFSRQESGTAIDENGNGVPEDDANVRLYSFYFDSSEHGLAFSLRSDGREIRHGFPSFADFVDPDLEGDIEESDEDVTLFGVVTDGLRFSASFEEEDDSRAASGDGTTFVYTVFRARDRLFFNRFDVQNAFDFDPDATADLLSTAAAGQTLPPGLSGAEGAVGGEVIVHNGLLLWQFETADLDVATESFVLANVFDDAGPSATELLSGFDPSTGSVVIPTFPSADDVYSGDHGLAHSSAFFEQGSGLNVMTSVDVIFSTLDLDGSGPQIAQIDEYVTSSDMVAVLPGSLQTAMTRGGDHIFAAWRQPHLPIESSEPPPPGEFPTVSVFLRAVDTRATGPIGARISGDITENGTALRINADVLSDPDESSRNVIDFEFQSGLGDGRRSAATALQSDPLEAHLVWTQEHFDAVPSRLNIASDRIFLHTGLVDLDPDATPPVFLPGSGAASDTTIDTVDVSWIFQSPEILNLRNVTALDAGGGDLVVYYLNQGNHKNLASAVGDSGGGTQAVPALLLEIPISASGGPSFSAGEVIALSRIGNLVIVTGEPGCSPAHGHAIGPFMGTRGIDIDGIGPYLEPPARHPVCGYGPQTTTLVPAEGPFDPGDPFAAFLETRAFVWRTGMPAGAELEISRDGSKYGSPAFYQVTDLDVVATRVSGTGAFVPSAHHVFMQRHDSNRSSPELLDYRALNPLMTDVASGFTPPLSADPTNVGLDAPVEIEDFSVLLDGISLDLYFEAGNHLWFNRLDSGEWAGATLVDNDSPLAIQSSKVADLSGARIGQVPFVSGTMVFYTKDLGQDRTARLQVRIRD